ncbi:MAG: DUF2270 domain-containing protein [Candidatus Heimdallarchaeota archaeon]
MQKSLPILEQFAEKHIASTNECVPTSKDPINILLQFYRGEIARSNTYRRTIDSPTSWAVLLWTFTLSLYLSLPDSPWFTPLLLIPLLIFLLRKEIHRTQKYHSALTRAKMLQAILVECIASSSISIDHLKEALAFDKTDLSFWKIGEARFFSTYAMLIVLSFFVVLVKLSV